MPTLICYGDSNTYGYNPAAGGKYHVCWVDILAEKTGWNVINKGACGREIPQFDRQLSAVSASVSRVLIMLGSNDLLDGYSAVEAGAKMEQFLSSLPAEKVTLIAPVKFQIGTWVETDSLAAKSEKLQAVYKDLAVRMQISFVDTAGWKIPLSFDGVHYTPEGHRIFAEKLIDALADFYGQMY